MKTTGIFLSSSLENKKDFLQGAFIPAFMVFLEIEAAHPGQSVVV